LVLGKYVYPAIVADIAAKIKKTTMGRAGRRKKRRDNNVCHLRLHTKITLDIVPLSPHNVQKLTLAVQKIFSQKISYS